MLTELGDASHRPLVLGGRPRARRADQDLQVVHGRRQRALNRGVPGDRALSQRTPHGFDRGRELGERRQLCHRRAAPKCARDFLERLGVGTGGRRAQQQSVDLLDVLAGFQDEEVEERGAWRRAHFYMFSAARFARG